MDAIALYHNGSPRITVSRVSLFDIDDIRLLASEPGFAELCVDFTRRFYPRSSLARGA